MALWLCRGAPADARVFIQGHENDHANSDREALIGAITAAGDTSQFTGDLHRCFTRYPSDLRQAFFAFARIQGAQQVAI